MRKSLQVLLAAGSFLCLGTLLAQCRPSPQAAGDHAADREAIGGVLRAQQSAWNRADVDAFLDGYWHSPELTFSGSSGVARGWDGVLARYKKSYPDRAAMGHLDFSELEFRFWARMPLSSWENGT